MMSRSVLNDVIKFDLHIHSKESSYKEDRDIVSKSTVENISVLFKKLNEYDIQLFSVTDHNRFNSDLYLAIDALLNEKDERYKNVQNVLAGVEFDVTLEKSKEKCHIISIFDAKNSRENYLKIEKGIEKKLLLNREESYSREDFEVVLREIGLNVILIASQRSGVNNHSGKHNSLSESTDDIERIIRVGYISALEFQKPKVEGILLSNLHQLKLSIPLISGSDCHEWEAYPYHDSQNKNLKFHHSQAKMLPTFKGLLMAITLPEFRFNCTYNANKNYYKSITINGKECPLVNGVNAIIGENGAGKTTLLDAIQENIKEKYKKDIVNENNIKIINSVEQRYVKYISQGEIIKKFNDQTLFSENDAEFKPVDTEAFKKMYQNYSEGWKNKIYNQIEVERKRELLESYNIEYIESMQKSAHYINVTKNSSFTNVNNLHEENQNLINNLEKNVDEIGKEPYFDTYKSSLMEIKSLLKTIRDDIEEKKEAFEFDLVVKEIIYNESLSYSREVKKLSTAQDNEINEYNKQRQSLIDAVIDAVAKIYFEVHQPEEPKVISGISKKRSRGFSFNREAAYNGISMVNDFFKVMFTQDYREENKLLTISNEDDFRNAVMGCGVEGDIEAKWNDNFSKFAAKSMRVSSYVLNKSQSTIGNTLGELSLSYYEYISQDDNPWNVLIIDQPEDNISNPNISKFLIRYLNEIRDRKQVIFVTHNPLLVVNMDADNVIYTQKNDGKLKVLNGCLEFEDAETNILQIVANNMDGGRATIEKRLRIYE